MDEVRRFRLITGAWVELPKALEGCGYDGEEAVLERHVKYDRWDAASWAVTIDGRDGRRRGVVETVD